MKAAASPINSSGKLSGSMKADEKTLLVVIPMFMSSSLEYVAREGVQKTQQIHKNVKSTRELSTEAAVRGTILIDFLNLPKFTQTTLLPSLVTSG